MCGGFNGYDVGDVDIIGKSRFLDGIDIGAYEYPGIILVDGDVTGTNNGQTWATDYQYLQDAIGAAADGNKIWKNDDRYNGVATKDSNNQLIQMLFPPENRYWSDNDTWSDISMWEWDGSFKIEIVE